MWVAIRSWAPLLEESRQISRPTTPGPIGTTILIASNSCAWVVTTPGDSQLSWALVVYGSVTYNIAAANATKGHWNVKPINERDVNIVQVIGLVQGELSKGIWWSAVALAF